MNLKQALEFNNKHFNLLVSFRDTKGKGRGSRNWREMGKEEEILERSK